MDAWPYGSQRWIRDLVDPPVLRQFREQQRWMRELADPAPLRQLRLQQQWLRDLADPPLLRDVREQQRWLRDLADPPLLRQLRAQQQELLRTTRSTALAGVAAWQMDFIGRLEGVVETLDDAPDIELSGDDVAQALGFESAPKLVWAMEGLIKSLSAVAGTMWCARASVGFEVPDELLFAIGTWIAIAFAAIHFISGPPND